MTLPWRYMVPRPRYFQSLKIASTCPEIKTHIDRIAFYTAADTALKIPFLVGVVVAVPFAFIIVTAQKIMSALPDYSARRTATLRDAHSIITIDEIRKRIGLPEANRILMKKEASLEEANTSSTYG